MKQINFLFFPFFFMLHHSKHDIMVVLYLETHTSHSIVLQEAENKSPLRLSAHLWLWQAPRLQLHLASLSFLSEGLLCFCNCLNLKPQKACDILCQLQAPVPNTCRPLALAQSLVLLSQKTTEDEETVEKKITTEEKEHIFF